MAIMRYLAAVAVVFTTRVLLITAAPARRLAPEPDMQLRPIVGTVLPPDTQTAPPMPVQMPLPPLPPIGDKFLPTLAPIAKVQTGLSKKQRILGFFLKSDPDGVVIPLEPGVYTDEMKQQMQIMEQMIAVVTLVVGLVFLCGVVFVAHQYKIHKDEASRYMCREDLQGDFKTGLCDCFADLPGFLFAFLCPWIRWSDNVSMVAQDGSAEAPGKIPILGFWIAFATVTILTLLETVGGGMVTIILIGVLAYFRQKFRQAFDMKVNAGSFIQDIVLYCCCSC